MKGLLEKISIGACIALISISIINAIDYGIEGKYKEMHNSLNWVLWIGNTLGLMVLLRRKETIIESKDDYIESLETYKTLTDEHIVSLKELIEAHKAYSTGLEEQIKNYKGIIEDYQKINVINEKILREYKNVKPSRF